MPGIRPEIQGLRAVAVIAVVLFHVWPQLLPGGYVGVDVFFVISGFLITRSLRDEAADHGRISLLDFYRRRALRLLPAAVTVLVAVAAGSLVFISPAFWNDTAREIAASVLYFENLLLAARAVDYLAADSIASPVQHYWSLSIEEQFYLVWPIVMIATAAVARRCRWSLNRSLAVSLGTIFALSLAASVWLTMAAQQPAYFWTHTRIWELALGGLLALSVERPAPARKAAIALSAAGLGLIVASAFAFSADTPFPGWHALGPTVGAVLVILAGDARIGAWPCRGSRFLGYVGDRSYSLYLWHWPIIIFFKAEQGTISPLAGVALITLTLLVAHLSYASIEQRFRAGRGRIRRPLTFGTALICLGLLVPGLMALQVAMRTTGPAAHDDAAYPGPLALIAGAAVPDFVTPVPDLIGLEHDKPVVYDSGCHQNQKDDRPIFCTLGDPLAERIVAVFGDSHAAQWIPALDIIARREGWRLLTFTKSACPFGRFPTENQGRPYTSCAAWRENVVAELRALKPTYVFTSESHPGQIDRAHVRDGVRSVWADLTGIGATVIAIHDTPHLPFNPMECLSNGRKTCAVSRKRAASNDVVAEAARGLRRIRVVDLTDAICGPALCDAVVGNVIVWRDKHHLTATYAAKLASHLMAKAFPAGTPR